MASLQREQSSIPLEARAADNELPLAWEAAIGGVLRDMREARGWSQAFAVDRLKETWQIEMHQTTLAKLEAGRRPIRLAELYALSVLYGQSVLMVVMQESVKAHMIESASHVDDWYAHQLSEIDKSLDATTEYLKSMTDVIAGKKAILEMTHGYLSRNANKETDGAAADPAE